MSQNAPCGPQGAEEGVDAPRTAQPVTRLCPADAFSLLHPDGPGFAVFDSFLGHASAEVPVSLPSKALPLSFPLRHTSVLSPTLLPPHAIHTIALHAQAVHREVWSGGSDPKEPSADAHAQRDTQPQQCVTARLQPAGMGRGFAKWHSASKRGDAIAWLHKTDSDIGVELQGLMRGMEQLRDQIVDSHTLGAGTRCPLPPLPPLLLLLVWRPT